MNLGGLRAFARALPEPCLLLSRGGEVLDANPAAARLFGVAHPEIAGRMLVSLVADSPQRVGEYLASAARTGSLLPGSLTPSSGEPAGQRIRVEACALRGDEGGSADVVLLRLHPRKAAAERFVALNRTIEELTREAHQRRRAQEALRESERRMAFLARASHDLSSSLDLEKTLRTVARLAVPEFADWCAVDLLEPDGTLRRVAAEHPDPARVEFVHRIQRQYPPDPHAPHGAPHVVRTGEIDYMAEIPDELLQASARDEEHLRLIRELQLRSYIVAPLRSPTGILGAVTLVYAESGRTYRESDAAFVEDLARRAALGIENASLVRGLEEARRQLEEQATELEMQTEELQVQAAHLEEQAAELEFSNEQLEGARAEAEQRAQENRLLLESTGEGIYGIDSQGRCTFLNRAASEMLGYDPEECLGRNMHELAHARHADGTPFPEAECPIVEAVRSGKQIQVDEAVLWRKDGSPLWVRLSSGPIHPNGAVLGAVVAFSDITARKQLGEAADRAREEAVRANQAKSEFLAAMSHELRTPLNAIGGHLDIIDVGIHGPVTDAQRTAFGRIKANQEHLLGLINDILQFAKLEAGKLEYQIGDLVVHDLVASVMEMLEPQARARQLDYVYAPCDPSLALRGDRDRVQQILINLLSNAIKFTPPGGRIALSAEMQEGDVLIRVEDTGCGIAPDQLRAIWDPFVQVGRREEDHRHGVGLGLAISRDLARGMGGDIWVESEPGRGSIFTLRLPLVPAPHPASETAAPVPG